MADLRSLLIDISREQLADPDVRADLPSDKIACAWLGEPGATQEEIGLAEKRLGARLPSSYRAFLAESNGFQDIGPFIHKLYSSAEIDWFRVRNQDWIDAYQSGRDISPEEQPCEPGRLCSLQNSLLVFVPADQ